MNAKQLAEVYYHQGIIIESQVKAMGMQAENNQRQVQGGSMAYWEDSFTELACEIEDARIALKSIMEV